MEPAVITTGATLAISAARRILVVPSPRVFASIGGGGGGGIRFFGGGGGGGGREGGDSGASGAAAAAAAAALGEEAGTADADVILLHVEGMSCGGCAANVKRILESQVLILNLIFVWFLVFANTLPGVSLCVWALAKIFFFLPRI